MYILYNIFVSQIYIYCYLLYIREQNMTNVYGFGFRSRSKSLVELPAETVYFSLMRVTSVDFKLCQVLIIVMSHWVRSSNWESTLIFSLPQKTIKYLYVIIILSLWFRVPHFSYIQVLKCISHILYIYADWKQTKRLSYYHWNKVIFFIRTRQVYPLQRVIYNNILDSSGIGTIWVLNLRAMIDFGRGVLVPYSL